MNIEVQERASTFRHLLSELDILSTTWENMAEVVSGPNAVDAGTKTAAALLLSKETAATNAEGGKKKSRKSRKEGLVTTSVDLLGDMEDLLEIPEYTAVSVQAVDNGGAETARRKARVLFAAVGEPFYAVHAKAQRRVQLPEGLNLDKPFNASALNKLLSLETPENLTLATLSFTTTPPTTYDTSMSSYGGKDRDTNSNEDDIARLSNALGGVGVGGGVGGGGDKGEDSTTRPGQVNNSYSAFGNESNPNRGQYNNYPGMGGETTAANRGRSAEDNLFYLSSSTGTGTADILPLAQILAESFEGKKHKKVKGSKSDKRKKNADGGGGFNNRWVGLLSFGISITIKLLVN